MATTKQHPKLIQEILAGAHDEIGMDYILRAAEARKKHLVTRAGITKGATVAVADSPRSGPAAGKTGVIAKVSKIRATVIIPCPDCGCSDADDSAFNEMDSEEARVYISRSLCPTCYGCPDSYLIPTDLLTRVATPVAA